MNPPTHASRARATGFDGLRLLAAGIVIFGHAYPLTGRASVGLLANEIQTIGVKTFFVISGFLITRSWMSDPNLLRFSMKRFLRIMPGLFCICVITIFVWGPLVTELSMRSYFDNYMTWRYFWNIALFPIYNLPGVFTRNIFAVAVNGSLWSLPVEMAMYIGVPLFVGLNWRFAKIAIPALSCMLMCLSVLFVRLAPPAHPIVFWGSSLESALDAAFYFWAGATIAVHRLDRFGNIPAALCLFAVSSGLFGVSPILRHGNVWGEILLGLVLPYLVISLGQAKVPRLDVLHNHDYSYGLYLYGFIVQQTLSMNGIVTPVANAVLAFPATLILAAASWHFVERRALALKPKRLSRYGRVAEPASAKRSVAPMV